MVATIRRYPTEIMDFKIKTKLKIRLPHDPLLAQNEKAQSLPSHGMVAFQTMLETKYPDVDFGFIETNAEKEDPKLPKNALIITNELPQFLALQTLITSPSFYDINHIKENSINDKKFGFIMHRKFLEEYFQKGISTETLSPKEITLGKQVLAEIYATRYDEIKTNLINEFKNNTNDFPTSLEEIIKTLDKLEGDTYSLKMPKYRILAAEIIKYRETLTNPIAPFFKRKSVASKYDNVLARHNFNDPEKKQRLLADYKLYEEQIAEDRILLTVNPPNKNPRDLFQNPTIVNLYRKLTEFIEYSDNLKKRGVKKGQFASDLAGLLKASTDRFCKNFMEDPTDLNTKFTDFEKEFSAILDQHHPSLNDHRFNFKTFLKNLAIALTGVGLFVIAGKVTYHKIKKGKALPFFCQEKTTCQERLEAVRNSLKIV